MQRLLIKDESGVRFRKDRVVMFVCNDRAPRQGLHVEFVERFAVQVVIGGIRGTSHFHAAKAERKTRPSIEWLI
jgi:hypothetical protein